MTSSHIAISSDKATRLILVTPPDPRENLQGYILRLSEINCYERPSWIYSLFDRGLPKAGFAGIRQCMKELPKLTGFAARQFEEIAYGTTGASNYYDVSVGGRFDVPAALLDIKHPKVCPECVEEIGVVRSLWDLRPYVVCEKHKRFLIRECSEPNCRAPISWKRPATDKCGGCEKPFHAAEAASAPSEDLLAFCKTLESRWYEGHSDIAKTGCSAIAGLNNKDFFKAVNGLTGRLREKGVENTPALSPAEIVITQTLATSFARWPDSFGHYMEELLRRDFLEQKGFSIGKSPRFKRLLEAAMEHSDEPHWRVVREAISHCVAQSHFGYRVTGKGGSRLAQDLRGNRQFLNRTETMQHLSISAATFRNLFRQGYLKGEVLQMGKQHVYRVTVDSIEGYKRSNPK